MKGRREYWFVALIPVLTALILFPIWKDPTRLVVGNLSADDARGTWHIYWMFRHFWPDISALSFTTIFNFPDGAPFLAPIGGFYPDHLMMIALQSVFGPALGLNIGVWLILTLLGVATWVLARRLSGSSWAAVISVAFIMSGPAILVEVTDGRNHAVVSLAFAALFLSELPGLVEGRRRAGLLAGLWMGLTTISYWYGGYLLVLLGGIAFLVMRVTPGVQRKPWVRPAGWAVLVATLIIAAPLGWLLSNISTIPGTPGGLGASLFPSHDVMVAPVKGAPPPGADFFPVHMFADRWLRLLIVGMAGWGIWSMQRGWKVFWTAFIVVGLVCSWGPIHVTGPGTHVKLPFYVLHRLLPLLWRYLWYQRILVLVDLAVVCLAARGLMQMWNARRAPRTWRLASVLVVLAVLVDPTGHMRPWVRCAPAPHAVSPHGDLTVKYLEGMRDRGAGAVIVYPGKGLMIQTVHGLPMMNSSQPRQHHRDASPRMREIAENPILVAIEQECQARGKPFTPADVAHLRSFGYTHIILEFSPYRKLEPDQCPDRVMMPNDLDFVRGGGLLSPEVLARFQRSILARRLEAALGPSERHGWLVVYDF